jgi:SAM-dependent methyltransferase
MTPACPVCESRAAAARRGRGGLRLLLCAGCGSAYLDGEAHPYRPQAIYDQTYFEPWDLRPGSVSWKLREETAGARLGLLSALGASGRLLDLGCAGGYLVAEALRRGFDAFGLEISEHAARVAESVAPARITRGTLESAAYAPASFDVVTAFDVVEHHPEPFDFVGRIRALLRPGGHFAATVPDLSSLTGRTMGAAWPHYKEEHRFYPTREAFRRLLVRAGLAPVYEAAARKRLSLAYLDPLLGTYPVPILTPVSRILARALPRSLREARLTLTIGERLYVARRES